MVSLNLNKRRYCKRCSCFYPFNEDFWHFQKQGKYLSISCILCSKKNVAAYMRRCRKLNPEKYKKQFNDYYILNKKRINDRHNRNQKKRKIKDVNYKIACNVRVRFSRSIKLSKQFKSGSSIKDCGCSLSELKNHLQSNFKPGMTWENHGLRGWHIDHIKPLSKFDLSNREEFLKAVHYTNLQPLWASENIRKGNKEFIYG